MKYTLVLLVVLAVSFKASSVPLSKYDISTRSLEEDLNDFLAVLPVDKITEIFYEFLSDDEDFGEMLDNLLSEEFKLLVIDIVGMAEVRNFLNFLQEAGLDVYSVVNIINQFLGIDEINPIRKSILHRITGGLPGFIKDIKAILPVVELKKLYDAKLKSSKEFAELISRLKSKEAQELVNKLMANPKLKDLFKRAEAKGVNVKEILDLITSIFGINFPSSKLRIYQEEEVAEILKQMWAMVPQDEILDVIVEYFINDEDVKKVYKFMMGGEFKEILVDIEDLPETSALLKYLYSFGLDAYSVVNDFNSFIGLEKHVSASRRYRRMTGGMMGLIHDVYELLPKDELTALFEEKKRTNKQLKDFVEHLEEYYLQNLIEALNHNEGFNLLLIKLEALDVDFRKITDIITAIIGVKFPERPQ